jgi:hypothetical protein
MHVGWHPELLTEKPPTTGVAGAGFTPHVITVAAGEVITATNSSSSSSSSIARMMQGIHWIDLDQ